MTEYVGGHIVRDNNEQKNEQISDEQNQSKDDRRKESEAERTLAQSDDLRYPNADKIYE